MDDNDKPDKTLHAQCLICKAEIPHAEVLTIEGQEYAYYFCGQGCYQQWQREQDVKKPEQTVKH